jgi:4'-phosphopantetheinyl transferase
MQAIESENLILYQTDLRGQWPELAARDFAARLPYARRLALRASSSVSRASLAGMALALRALTQLLGRSVLPSEMVFAHGQKPRLAVRPAATAGEDFSISHAGPWVACAALARGRVGLDIEMGTDERIAAWVVREAVLKASGEGLRALRETQELLVQDARVRWRGEVWQVRRLEEFAGASACLVCNLEAAAVERHTLALAELFGT